MWIYSDRDGPSGNTLAAVVVTGAYESREHFVRAFTVSGSKHADVILNDVAETGSLERGSAKRLSGVV
jgi:hypothetical protein